MAYTVKEISQISGVTIRTLHFYEEAGLFKPAYYGANGYRYFEMKELVRLQQILFFKELGFTIKEIRRVLSQSGFNILAALHSQKKALKRDFERKKKLIETIDRTIQHLNGKKQMKDKDFFSGFDVVRKGKGSEPYFQAETIVLSHLREAAIDKEEIGKKAQEILSRIARLIDAKLSPESEEVQTAVKEHHTLTDQVHIATKEVYLALAELYRTHPIFKKQLDEIHPKLYEYLPRAMKAFANKNL